MKDKVKFKANHVCSLGTCCHSAFFLEGSKWRAESYPFDWICTDLNIVTHAISDNFKTFLDKNMYTSVASNRCIHNQYKPTYGPVDNMVLFKHRNPTLQKDYDYYLRCVDRFNKLLALNSSKLFTIMTINCPEWTPISIERMKELTYVLNNTLEPLTTNYRIAHLIHTANQPERNCSIQTVGNVDFINLNFLSESTASAFKNVEDNTCMYDVFTNLYDFEIIPLKLELSKEIE